MKVTAVLGSPIRNGNSEKMVNLFLSGFSGDDISIFNINELNCKGCQACDECQKSDSIECTLHDELQPVLNRLAISDLIVLASPMYMDQVTAQMRIFQDRLNVFLRKDFSSKLKDTPTVLIFSQAIEDMDNYKDYFKTLKKVYKKFNMNVIDTIILADAGSHNELQNDLVIQDRLKNWRTNYATYYS
ncbi:MAG: flavodoxin family protein [Firmicutes bacterium]|nr:flavodoxin family protein [Bacillota bacterium]